MKIDESMRLDSQLCFPLYAASRKVVNLYTPHLKPLGITYTQYIMFLVLWEKDNIIRRSRDSLRGPGVKRTRE